MRETLGKVFLCFLVVSFVASLLVQPVRAEFNPGGVVAEANSLWIKLASFVFPPKKSSELVPPAPPPPAPVLGVADDLLNSLKARVDSLEQQVSGLLNAPAPTAISPSSLSLVSSNLLRNSSFEADSGGQPRQWNYQLDSNSGNTFKSAEGIHSGSYGLKIVGGGSGNFGISQPNTKTTPGRTYTFSVYVKIINAPTTTVRLGFWDEQNNGYGPMKDFSFSGNRDWTRINMTATTTGLITDFKNWFPLVEVHGLTAGAVYLDDALLTEGSILTAYNSMQASGSNSSGGLGDGAILTSISGDIYPAISGNGSLGTTSNKWSALNLSNANIDSNGNLTVNGSVTLGSSSSGTITANAQFNTSLIPSSNQSYDLGSSSLRWNNIYANALNINGSLTSSSNASYSGTLGVGGQASMSAYLTFDAANPQINATNNRNLTLGAVNTGRVNFFSSSNYVDSSGNLALVANLALAGSAVSASNYLTAPNWSVTTAGLETLASNLAVNGGSITTSQTTANLFNATATTINIGGAGTTNLNNASASGTLGAGGEASLSAKLILGSVTPQINATNNRPLQIAFQNTGQTQFYSAANYIDSSGNEALAANLGIAGSAVSASNYLTAPNFSVSTAGLGTFASNVAVNGGSVTTTAATGNLFNASATTLNIGGAATTISLGAASGTTTINNNATASGTLGVGGNASMSAYLTLGATNPQINVTNNRALVLGAANTGSVQFFSSSNAINSAGSITVAAGGGLDVSSAGTLALGNATATTINIGQSSAAGTTINIGTAVQADTITIGNTTGATAVNINAGSGLINLSAGNSATASAFVINTNTGANAAGLAVKLGNTALATTNNFATFLDGSGRIVGKINAASATSVGYQTQGIDYAEWFFKASGAGNMPVHTLVCFNDAGTVQPCAEGGQILGIVSDQAGFIGGMNREGPNAALVGLVGQLRLNVVGPVAAGDFLTSSSTPGSARKATKPGQVIGVAMESSSGSTGLVYTSINPGFADPSAVQVAQTLGAVTQQVADLTAKVNNNATVTAAAVGGPTTNTSLSTLSQFDSVLASKLEVKGLALFDSDIKVSGEAVVGSLNISGAITVNFVAGEDLSAGDVVSLASDGTVHKFGNSAPVIGIVTSAVTKGNSVKVAVGGIVSGLSGLTVGQRYLAADGGRLTTTVDSTKFNQVVGLAVSGTSLLVQVGIYSLPGQNPSPVSVAPTAPLSQPSPISPAPTTVSQTPTPPVVAGSSSSASPSGQQPVATSSGVVNPGTSQVGSKSATLK